MRFDDKKYPVLPWLVGQKNLRKAIIWPRDATEADSILDMIQGINERGPAATPQYISKTVDSIITNNDFLVKLGADFLGRKIPQLDGTLINGMGVIWYTMLDLPEEEYYHITACSFVGMRMIAYLNFGIKEVDGVTRCKKSSTGTWSILQNTDKNKSEAMLSYILKTIVDVQLFKICATVVDKRLEAKTKKAQIISNQPYRNLSSVPIDLIDAHWFTNIYVEGDFKVSGHFRFQPCGKGHKDIELIWIDPFIKHGYTRKAKILQKS